MCRVKNSLQESSVLNVVSTVVLSAVTSFHIKASNKGYRTETIPKKGVRVDPRCPLHKNGTLELFCVGGTVALAH